MKATDISGIDKTISTEEAILLAAERQFISKGYMATRTTDVATEAGVTHAMLHYYFRTKEHLFEEVVSRKMDNLRKVLVTIFPDENLSIGDKFRHAISEHMDFLIANSDLPRFLIQELPLHPTLLQRWKEGFREISKHLISNIQRVINEGAERGECSPIDARIILADIVSLNVFPFLAKDIMDISRNLDTDNLYEFQKIRKEENIRTILKKLNIKE